MAARERADRRATAAKAAPDAARRPHPQAHVGDVPHGALALQRTAGNAAVGRMLHVPAGTLQRVKVTVPSPLRSMEGEATFDTEIQKERAALLDWIATAVRSNPHALGELITELEHAPAGDNFAAQMLKRAIAARDEPQVGIEGISYPGPSRFDRASLPPQPPPEPGKKAPPPPATTIHRGEAEIEQIAGKPFIRLYTTVPSAAEMTSVDLEAGSAASEFKDVQQDVDSGKIFISSGHNRMLWVSAGRPLRAVKWAAKYQASREATAEQAMVAWSGTFKRRLDLDPGKDAEEHEALRAQGHRYLRAATAVTKFDAPLIRSYLVPLEWFNEVSKRAVLEAMVGDPTMKDKTFNVDRHAEANQFGFTGKDLAELGKQAKPESLITYAYDTEYAGASGTAGAVKPIQELWDRLGIPPHALTGISPFLKKGEFQDRDKVGPIADELNMHYVTWRQRKDHVGVGEPAAHPLLSEAKAKLPWRVRVTLLTKFLDDQKAGVAALGEEKFMETVVLPWASQGMIEHTMASDYDLMEKDEDVLLGPDSRFDSNDFDTQRERAPERERMLEEAGRRVDAMVLQKRPPDEIVDALIASVPELRARFAKISAKTERYTLYDHVQMVLGQFRKLGVPGEPPLYDEAMMTKLILLHDIEKTNSKAQFGSDPIGAHKLTVDEIRKYGRLWNKAELRATVAIVGGDPFGEYMKLEKKPDRDGTFMAIVAAAKQAGVEVDRYPAFFHEFHRFYQADFSSYTTDSRYVPHGETELRSGKPTFDDLFEWKAGSIVREGGRLRYSVAGEERYEALAAMFASPEVVTKNLERLDASVGPLVAAARREDEGEGEGVGEIDDDSWFGDLFGKPSTDAHTS
jgi:hypothetical protein